MSKYIYRIFIGGVHMPGMLATKEEYEVHLKIKEFERSLANCLAMALDKELAEKWAK